MDGRKWDWSLIVTVLLNSAIVITGIIVPLIGRSVALESRLDAIERQLIANQARDEIIYDSVSKDFDSMSELLKAHLLDLDRHPYKE